MIFADPDGSHTMERDSLEEIWQVATPYPIREQA